MKPGITLITDASRPLGLGGSADDLFLDGKPVSASPL